MIARPADLPPADRGPVNPLSPALFSSTAAEGKGEPEAPNTCCAVSYSNVKAEATVYKGKIVAHVQTPQLNVM